MSRNSNYDKNPFIPVSSSRSACWLGWQEIGEKLAVVVGQTRQVLCVDCYPGAFEKQIQEALEGSLRPTKVISTAQLLKPAQEIDRMLKDVLGDDPVFGLMNDISLESFFETAELESARKKVTKWETGLLL